MATDTASASVESTASSLRTRNYWQLPLFLLGVMAAIGAYLQFPPQPATPEEQFARNLTRLRVALDRRPTDLGTVRTLVDAVSAESETHPESLSQARYLAGSGYLAMAEAEPTNSTHWADAVKCFAAITPASLPESDRAHAAFRRAKAEAGAGQGDPAQLAVALNTVPSGEEVEGERRRLLAEVYLRGKPVNWKGFRDEMTSYLSGPSRLPAANQAEYRLKLAEAYLALNEPAKAVSWLKEIREQASKEVQAQAKVLQAKMASADNRWADAATLYAEALASPGLPADQRGTLALLAGNSQLKQKNTLAAKEQFEAALKQPGEVATAAAVRLAEILVQQPDDPTKPADTTHRGRAVALLNQAVATVSPDGTFTNAYLTPTELRASFEEVIQVLINEANFPTALQVVEDYSRIAETGRSRERRADINAKWAALLQKAPATAKEAVEKFKAAAADYSALATSHPVASGRADLLRRAASCLRLSGDEQAVIAIADRIASTPGLPEEIIAAAWVDKGEALLASNQFAEAVTTFTKAMQHTGVAATQARVKLAMAHIEQAKRRLQDQSKTAQEEAKGLLDLGRNLLAQVANRSPESPAEKDAQQQALYELGKLLLDQGNVPDAEARFRQMVQTHPTGPLMGQGKLYLGSCLLLLARGDNQDGRTPADAERKLTEARQLFAALSDSSDPYLRMHADIRLVNTLLLLKKYDDIPPLCDKLATRYQGKVEELIVLSMLYSSYRLTDRPEPAAKTLVRMEEVFAKMPATEFTAAAEEYTREYWQKNWFKKQ